MAAKPESPAGMGHFSKIPVELRDQIWRECSYVTKSSLTQTCKQLRSDVRDCVHDNLAISFDIDPRQLEKPSPSLIKVLDQEGNLICSVSLSALQKDNSIKLWGFPFDKVKSFEFIIWPPGPRIAGESIRLWKLTTCLLAKLRKHISKWPPIMFYIKESESRSWMTSGDLNQSITKPPSWHRGMFLYRDIEAAILPFSTLRRLPQRPWIMFPEGIPQGTSGYVNRFILRNSCDIRVYGHSICWEEDPIDNECASNLAEWSLLLERRLDVLDDRAAASLRLERCANWSKLYEIENAYLFMGQPILCDECRDRRNYSFWGGARLWTPENRDYMKQLLWDRYRNMRHLNPAKQITNELRCDRNDDESVADLDGWDARLWWDTYRDGIPPLSHNSHRRDLEECMALYEAGNDYEIFGEIDRNGIQLWDERDELDVRKGGWWSWPDDDLEKVFRILRSTVSSYTAAPGTLS